jgi:hypothetical protein
MRKLVLLVLGVVLLIAQSTVLGVSHEEKQVIENEKMVLVTSKIENASVISNELYTEISEDAFIEEEVIDDELVILRFYNKMPTKTVVVGNEKLLNIYTISSIVAEKKLAQTTKGSGTNSYTDWDYYVKVYGEVNFYKETISGLETHKPISFKAKLVNNWEETHRNLSIEGFADGVYESYDGTISGQGWNNWDRTIASPYIGSLYSKYTNFSYYYITEGFGVIGLDVSVEWSHNFVTYYTSDFELIRIGSYTGF